MVVPLTPVWALNVRVVEVPNVSVSLADVLAGVRVMGVAVASWIVDGLTTMTKYGVLSVRPGTAVAPLALYVMSWPFVRPVVLVKLISCVVPLTATDGSNTSGLA